MPEARIPFLHVVCYKWGTRYPAREVNILKAMVDRNLTVPHDFHCITDDARGLDPAIVVHALPGDEVVGFYRKLYSFSENFLNLRGKVVLVLDIDLVIVDNIDFLAENPEKDFIVAPDGRTDGRTHTAVYRLRVGSHPQVWAAYIRDPEAAKTVVPERKDRDQFWTELMIDDIEYFARGKIVSYKYNCNSETGRIFGKTGARLGLTLAHFGAATVPEGAAIVSFHGEPIPRDVRDGRFLHYRHAPFVRQHWHL